MRPNSGGQFHPDPYPFPQSGPSSLAHGRTSRPLSNNPIPEEPRTKRAHILPRPTDRFDEIDAEGEDDSEAEDNNWISSPAPPGHAPAQAFGQMAFRDHRPSISTSRSSALGSGHPSIAPLAGQPTPQQPHQSRQQVQSIIGNFTLSSSSTQQLLDICRTSNEADQPLAFTCFVTQQLESLNQRLDLLGGELRELATHVLPETPRHWSPSEVTKTYIRKALARLIRCPLTATYSANSDAQGSPIKMSLENRVMFEFRNETREFHEKHLPPGFSSSAPEANAVLMKEIKRVAAQARSKFQVDILIKIKDHKGDPVIPTNKQLIALLTRKESSAADTRSDDDIDKTTDKFVKLRYALMRIEGLNYHLLHPEERKQPTVLGGTPRSMWNNVDERLMWLHGLPAESQRRFQSFVRDTESSLFDGEKTFKDIQSSGTFRWPPNPQLFIDSGSQQRTLSVQPSDDPSPSSGVQGNRDALGWPSQETSLPFGAMTSAQGTPGVAQGPVGTSRGSFQGGPSMW